MFIQISQTEFPLYMETNVYVHMMQKGSHEGYNNAVFTA